MKDALATLLAAVIIIGALFIIGSIAFASVWVMIKFGLVLLKILFVLFIVGLIVGGIKYLWDEKISK